MTDNYTRLEELLNGYAAYSLTEVEENELLGLLNQADEAKVEAMLVDILERTDPMPDAARRERILRELGLELGVNSTDMRGARILRLIKRVAVAASILLVLGVGFLMLDKKRGGAEKPATIVEIEAPATNRAMITLADGRVVYLDSVANGQLASQNDVKLVKSGDGVIVYEGASTSLSMTYNTLNNPRGSKVVNLTLNDGTKVWLNSESSLKYPAAFIGNTREVEITGEAYFEVAKDATKKFIVKGNGLTTEVLGTHFNVNTYNDEKSIKVTLLEGSVKTLIVNGEWSVLKPGEQAEITNNIKVVKGVDVDAVMAWKNGYFQLSGSNLQAIMRQLERWYDVEVVYEGAISQRKFGGQLPRTVRLSEVLKILEESDMHFKIEGRRVVVK